MGRGALVFLFFAVHNSFLSPLTNNLLKASSAKSAINTSLGMAALVAYIFETHSSRSRTGPLPWQLSLARSRSLGRFVVLALIAVYYFSFSGTVAGLVSAALYSVDLHLWPVSEAMSSALKVLVGYIGWVALSLGTLRLVPGFYPVQSRAPGTRAADKESEWYSLRASPSTVERWHWWAIGAYCLSVAGVGAIDWSIQHLSPAIRLAGAEASSLTHSYVVTTVAPGVWSTLIGAIAPCIIGPWWEELLFRGYVLPLLAGVLPLGHATVLSSVLFAAQHLQIGSVFQLAYLSLIWAWLYLSTGTLLLPVLVHTMWNTRPLFDALLLML